MNFVNTIDKIINELQQGDMPNPESLSPNNDPSNLMATTPQEPEIPEVEVTKLSPESEVLLVRLIKKALATKIDAEDLTAIGDFEDINENNAKEALKRLINILKKYSSDIDVGI